ncbi:MAG TPA: peptidylprolyl isomerase [Trueperaceae bacterium]
MNPNITSSNRLCIAVLALLILLLTAAWAQSDEPTNEPADSSDEVVLKAGEYEETESEFESRFEIAIRGLAASQGLQLTDEVRSQLARFKPSYLEQRAAEVALLQEAEERGIVVSEEEVEGRLAEVRGNLAEGQDFGEVLEQAGFRDESQLRQLVKETETIQRTVDAIEAEIEVSDEEVMEFYEANQQMFEQPEQVCARHILVETVEEAEQTLADLEAGAEFAELAAERSIDPGSPDGDLGCFGRGRMVPPFEEAAFSAEVGEPVGPVESQFGQHIILVYDRQEATVADLEEVRPSIEQQLRSQQLAAAIEEVRQASNVEIFPERLDVPAPEEAAPEAPDGAVPAAPEEAAPATPDGEAAPAAPEDAAPEGEGEQQEPAPASPDDESAGSEGNDGQ